MNRIYYPLKPTGKRYRREKIAVLSICIDSDGIFKVSQLITRIDNNWLVEDFSDTGSLVNAMLETPPGTWFITYDIDFIACLFEDTITRFTAISGLGKDTTVLTLQCQNDKWYIVDARQFFLEPIVKVARNIKIGLEKYPDDDQPVEAWEKYNNRRAVTVLAIWRNLESLLCKYFGVYPSRTPGATALKCWRVTMPSNVKARSPRIRKLIERSLRGGALHWQPGYYDTSYHYDINAAYVSCMKVLEYPLHVQTFSGHAPPSDQWIATVVLSYKTEKQFSPFSTRIEDKTTIHPTEVKHLRTCITYIDYQVMGLLGEVTIHEWIEGIYWKPERAYPVFRDWAEIVETASQESVKAKYFLKVVSRALHSKFAQTGGAEITTIKQVKPATLEKLIKSGKCSDIYLLNNGKIAVKFVTREKPKFKPFLIPDWETLTLAAGRLLLYTTMDENTIYLDTDCIISTTPRPDLPAGTGFGLWKLQNSGPCVIAGPRMYVYPNMVKSAGIYTPDRKELEAALWNTARGKIAVLTAYERSGILATGGTINQNEKTRDHEIKQIPYPKSVANGLTAVVTRSPAKKYKINTIERMVSNDYPDPLCRK